ncbi:hypothetical protein IWZ00DRAFT_513118 [Phyllosticta capitalensis]
MVLGAKLVVAAVGVDAVVTAFGTKSETALLEDRLDKGFIGGGGVFGNVASLYRNTAAGQAARAVVLGAQLVVAAVGVDAVVAAFGTKSEATLLDEDSRGPRLDRSGCGSSLLGRSRRLRLRRSRRGLDRGRCGISGSRRRLLADHHARLERRGSLHRSDGSGDGRGDARSRDDGDAVLDKGLCADDVACFARNACSGDGEDLTMRHGRRAGEDGGGGGELHGCGLKSINK